MHVYVLETMDRCDEYCEYNSDIVDVYSEEKFEEAKEHWKELCELRANEGDEINKWRKNGGYFFNCNNGKCEDYRFSYVGLRKMKVR